jgi:serine/threonine protein kinase
MTALAQTKANRNKKKIEKMNSNNQNDFETNYRTALKKHGYRFSQVIGKGGMSRVDEVREIATGQLKAIKHLGNSLPADKVDRFKKTLKRETEYAFDHPNVLKGESYFQEDGNVFFVMPRMQHNLDHMLDDKQDHPLAFLLDIIVQTAAGMNYLHQNDIIHRDLKPSNILYNQRQNDIWVAICDFGLSQDKMAKFKNDLSRKLLRGGRRAGTVNYSAPEQMHKNGKYDKRCDIYSFGRLMDELVGRKATRQKKFINTFQQDRQIDALSKKVYLYKMDRPRILDGEVRSYLPFSLLNLILRCLQKNHKRRPPDIVQTFYELTKIQQECRMLNGGQGQHKEMLTCHI